METGNREKQKAWLRPRETESSINSSKNGGSWNYFSSDMSKQYDQTKPNFGFKWIDNKECHPDTTPTTFLFHEWSSCLHELKQLPVKFLNFWKVFHLEQELFAA